MNNTTDVSPIGQALERYTCNELSKEDIILIGQSESAKMIATMYEAKRLRAASKTYQFQITHLAASTDGQKIKEYRVDHYNIDKDGIQTLVNKDAFKIEVEQTSDDDGDYLVTWKFDETDGSRTFMKGLFQESSVPQIKLFITSAKNTSAQVTELASTVTLKMKSKHRYESFWENDCPTPGDFNEQCSFHIEISND